MLYNGGPAGLVCSGHGQRKAVRGVEARDIISGEVLLQARRGLRHCHQRKDEGELRWVVQEREGKNARAEPAGRRQESERCSAVGFG